MISDNQVPRRLALATGLGAIGLAVSATAPTSADLLQLPDLNIRTHFGAKGDDRTDDTAAIQDALDHVIAAGGMLIIPRGIYRVAGLVARWINPPRPIMLIGEGPHVSVLRGVGTTPVLTLDATDAIEVNSQFRSFSIDRTGTSGHGLVTRQIARAAFECIGIEGCSIGWQNQGSLILRVTSSFFNGNDIGVSMQGHGAITPNLISFSRCDARANRHWGFDLDDGDGIRLVDCELSNNGHPSDPATGALVFRARLGRSSSTASVTVDGCWFEANRGTALLAEDAAALRISARDTVFYSSEHGRAINIGAVGGVILDNIRAPSPGDRVVLRAASSLVRGGIIHTLDDQSTVRSHSSVATGMGLINRSS